MTEIASFFFKVKGQNVMVYDNVLLLLALLFFCPAKRPRRFDDVEEEVSSGGDESEGDILGNPKLPESGVRIA